jgi:hypothetical protein
MPATVTCIDLGRSLMVAVMIGVDPHKGSHTAVAISPAEEPLGELRVRACAGQAERLLDWAAAWPQRTWAIEGASGLGHLLAQQLLAAGEQVVDVQPKLGARVRLLATGAVNKNDPNDARSVAVAALRSPAVCLALERCACPVGPCRGVARKRDERPPQVWYKACPPRLPEYLVMILECADESDDRG